ncbi:MAG: hypothetical protein AABW89_02705 [Nanoarchaeota archaeon]
MNIPQKSPNEKRRALLQKARKKASSAREKHMQNITGEVFSHRGIRRDFTILGGILELNDKGYKFLPQIDHHGLRGLLKEHVASLRGLKEKLTSGIDAFVSDEVKYSLLNSIESYILKINPENLETNPSNPGQSLMNGIIRSREEMKNVVGGIGAYLKDLESKKDMKMPLSIGRLSGIAMEMRADFDAETRKKSMVVNNLSTDETNVLRWAFYMLEYRRLSYEGTDYEGISIFERESQQILMNLEGLEQREKEGLLTKLRERGYVDNGDFSFLHEEVRKFHSRDSSGDETIDEDDLKLCREWLNVEYGLSEDAVSRLRGITSDRITGVEDALVMISEKTRKSLILDNPDLLLMGGDEIRRYASALLKVIVQMEGYAVQDKPNLDTSPELFSSIGALRNTQGRLETLSKKTFDVENEDKGMQSIRRLLEDRGYDPDGVIQTIYAFWFKGGYYGE